MKDGKMTVVERGMLQRLRIVQRRRSQRREDV